MNKAISSRNKKKEYFEVGDSRFRTMADYHKLQTMVSASKLRQIQTNQPSNMESFGFRQPS